MTLQAGKFSTLRTDRAAVVRSEVQVGAPHFGAQCAEVHLAHMPCTGTLVAESPTRTVLQCNLGESPSPGP